MDKDTTALTTLVKPIDIPVLCPLYVERHQWHILSSTTVSIDWACPCGWVKRTVRKWIPSRPGA